MRDRVDSTGTAHSVQFSTAGAEIVPAERKKERRPSINSEDKGILESNSDEAVVRCLGIGDNFNDDDEDLNTIGSSSNISSRFSGISQSSSVKTEGSTTVGETPGDSIVQRQAFAAFGDVRRKQCMWLADNKFFTSVFMFLTFYALFAPDVDMLTGTKESFFVLSVVNTVVCVLFMLEIVVQSLGKDKYFLRAYFWLDTVAMISLLPETWVFQRLMQSNSGFAAGRSSRLARIVRVASRSSKATRLNRLTRIARMASLLPKISTVFGNRVSPAEIQKLVHKKLNRAFRLLDPGDGKIARQKVTSFIQRTRAEFEKPAKTSSPGMVGGLRNRSQTKSTTSSSLRFRSGTESRSSRTSEEVEYEKQRSTTTSTSGTSPASGKTMEISSVGASMASADMSRQCSASRSVVSRRTSYNDDVFLEDTDTVDFQEFATMMKTDGIIGPRLYKSCEVSIRRGNNMRTITRIHSEYIAVRVALAVILLLFVIGLVSPILEDFTLPSGIQHLTVTMRSKYPSATAGDVVPETVQKQIQMLFHGISDGGSGRQVFYLDINKLIYCDKFKLGLRNCTVKAEDTYWGYRKSLEAIDQKILDSKYRMQDFVMFAEPDLSGEDLDEDQRDDMTYTVALIYDRSSRQTEARLSIMTTVLVIVVILLGIVLLTRDLNIMSSNLLKPLRELADDMESIAQLQLAGAAGSDEPVTRGTDEVKQIRRTFDNMKRAIKSWGKYVPWPVVQKLLAANIEADLKMEEVEASMYFSDIAGFTTIVESLPPERSLLLLNRYFNDMTKVIDDHGGVVIEFIGDAIYCIYGQPLENRLHPAAAVKGALRMLSALKRLNSWAATKQLPQVSIRCGVHTGMVLVGNMGFGSRMKYGIVGEDAQFPSRLEELNKTYTTKCLVSDTTCKRLHQIQPDYFITRPVDFMQLRQAPGSEPEWIHEVMAKERKDSRTHPYWEAADLHMSGMEMYRRREFAEAVEVFEQVKEFMETGKEDDNTDGPSVLMLKRCRAYLESPPSDSWNGVWDG